MWISWTIAGLPGVFHFASSTRIREGLRRKKHLMTAETGLFSACQMRKLRRGISCGKSGKMIGLLSPFII